MKYFIRRELPCRRNGEKGKLISVYLGRAMTKVTNHFRLCVCVRVRMLAYLNSIVAFSTTHIICRIKVISETGIGTLLALMEP